MMRMGKLLLPAGVIVGVIGAVVLTAGVVGMMSWPMPGWTSGAFSIGMGLTIPGAFMFAFGMFHRVMNAAMPDGALRPSGSGGLFGMIDDLAGGNRDLLVNGVPASAVILSMRDTGVTVNDLPMVMFDLEVRREGAAAYRVAHRERIPRLLVGAVLPGAHLPVRIDPDDHGRLTVDWEHAAGHVPPSAGQRVSAADVLARGVPAMATVAGTFSTNGMTADNGDPIVGLFLHVAGPHGPYEVRLAHRVPPHHLASLLPGTRLLAKIAPEDPQKVAIDWTAAHPTPEPQSL
ncbi:hypothetical protein ACTMTI_45000 [Nonomuraea sp. H19]|uniref:hypothetical protein n=1 Tax=Nonomuraea sp. H19 TaxID=3452206 RepID=UPI003F8A4CA0